MKRLGYISHLKARAAENTAHTGPVRLCHFLDDLISRMLKVNNAKRRRWISMAAFRLRQRIGNLVDEGHRKVAAFLREHYRLIFLPAFESADMVASAQQKIHSKTARALLTWTD